MAHRITTTTKPTCLLYFKSPIKYHQYKPFSTSKIQWFHRFLSPKEEKQLYKGITTLFRERLHEKSNSSNQLYKNIIHQIILGTSTSIDPTPITTTTTSNHTLTLSQLDQYKKDIESAGKLKDTKTLNHIWLDMKKVGSQIPITMYNRLIRAFLNCHEQQEDINNKLFKKEEEMEGFLKAKEIIQVIIQDQHRLPTTRTLIYMIQGYLKRNQLEEAKHYVNLLHHYSLDKKLKSSFDCSIMMKYYIQSGDTHAADFLWRDIKKYVDIIQPGPNLFTIYAESLLSSYPYLSQEMIADVSRSFVHHFHPSTSTSSTINHHQLFVWLKVVQSLVHSNHENDFYYTDAESLLLCLINISSSNHSLSPSIQKQGIQVIQDLFHIYLEQSQDVKVLAFYYKLRKAGVSKDVFDKDLTLSIGNVLKRIEKQKHEENDSYNQKALLEEFGLNLGPL
ncbi:unnamed protein product [Cunninghamella blakesleeana]